MSSRMQEGTKRGGAYHVKHCALAVALDGHHAPEPEAGAVACRDSSERHHVARGA